MSNSRLDRNIVVLGGVGVGKSSVIARFTKGEYSEKYVPTVSGFHSKKITVDKKEYNLSISDTTGQDESSLLDSSHIGSTDVFLIAFSVNNRRSYMIAQVVREKILEQAGVDSVGMILVGNKCDLKDERQVSTKEVQELAAKFGCPYVETSSREGTNVEELFDVATRVANKSRGGSSDEEDETSLLDSTYVGSMDVYVIAFSVNYRRSFEIAQVIRDKILEQTGVDSVGIVLVGNKSDLKDERQVSTKEAQELATKFGCPYVETSAREGINIEELFIRSVCVANKSRGGSGNDVEGDDATDKSMCFIM
ncbi:hypothetical protein GGI19_001317 [Coemansia pectinata]|uniref:Uncharacterized protein n=1 Tax=Coemansia pectinata TaxID=1052879 RepID=A0A9W8GYE2_9FUNG|nr:hypothetical protein GGI19_001317 [Coemansia pectinata]